MPSSRPVRPLPGFTLVELLVVISIVGVLVAVLLPAITMARSESMFVTCMSKQRQVTLAYNMYILDNKERIPSPLMGGNYMMYIKDQWNWGQYPNSTPSTPVNMAMLFKTQYLRGGASAYCPDHPQSRGANFATGVKMLDEVYAKGSFTTSGMPSTSYLMRAPSGPDHQGAAYPNNVAQAVFDWRPWIEQGYTHISPIAPKLQGNLPGGDIRWTYNYDYRRLLSPRAIVMCLQPTYYDGSGRNAHGDRGLVASFIDGVVVRRTFAAPTPTNALLLPTLPGSFLKDADPAYPNFKSAF